ncbi:nitrogen fixation protein FixH [Ancylobacter aquaticus]|uniref:Nitrogen fixation protein FixH n=1 Tax=Ancylobacter aquaticus TaxID=100 RepID=A0A4R1IGR7_ANCAQ|nr:FixH family protein [Ancylobacter aquaticus]TCK30502.1 nitrogen fixation protein FixH [Ancylobacter aquaticus]
MASPVNGLDDGNGRPLTGRTVLICFLAFFGVIFTANFFLVRAAVTSFGGVETESSYKAGLAFRAESEAAAAQEARHWQVDAHVEPGRVDVSARDAAGRPIADAVLAVTLQHPTNRRLDVTLDPVRVSAGRWRADDTVASGQWELVIELSREGERLFRSTNRVVIR